MARRAYARRYAQAVFEIALETGELDRWQSDLRKIISVVGDAAFMALLESPKFHFDDKARLLSERLEGVNPLALNLVRLLVTKGKLGMIGDIADEYQRLVDNYRGIEGAEVAEVTTAIPLDDEDKIKLAQRLTSLVGKPVVLKPKVDSSLIGGVIIRVGDKLIDGSIRNKLLALKRDLERR